MQTLLSVENSPPFAAPVRFFLSAPLFGMLAGLLLVIDGPSLFLSRWMPGTLAVTHLLTLGFMLQIMLGALIQILPVVAGANLARPERLSVMLRAGLSSGTLLLASGFYFGWTAGLAGGALVVLLFVGHFLARAGRVLFGIPNTSPTIAGIKLALLGLIVTVVLGGLMAFAMHFGWVIPIIALADWHAGWGLGGWSGVLLAAVAYVVVPMFQLTPGYPARPGWLFPLVCVFLLSAWGGGILFESNALVRAAQGLLAVTGLAFSWLTWRLQGKRRRARADTTYRYWQVGLIASIAALTLFLLGALVPSLTEWPGWPLLIGILLGVGGFMSFIAGMLYKIVPFLAWLHLQKGAAGKAPPNMNQLLPALPMQRQWQAHVLACLLLLAAVFWPEGLIRQAGLVFALANGGLLWNLLQVVRRYRLAAALQC